MKLFDIDDNREVLLNKAWIMMIPEFVELFKRDKGSEGDYRGSKKLRTIKELTYIYFMEDFSSPLRDWEPEEKQKEALYYANLTDKDIDAKVTAAQQKYADIMLKSSRSLRTLKSLYKGLDNMDTQFEKDDLFTSTDKMGKLKYTVSDFTVDVLKLDKVYDAVRNFEKRVEDDLKQAAAGIRGPNSTLGDNEGKKRAWSESDISQGSQHAGGPQSGTATFAGILNVVQNQAKKEQAQKRAAQQNPNMKDIFNMGDDEGGEEDDQ